MFLNKWGVRLALGMLVFAGALACRTADVFVAQVTVTPTRTPRPTFTPLPKATNTAVPSPTNPPPIATVAPTTAPSLTPTKRPTARPTAIPKQPTPVPQPVVSQPTQPPPAASRFEYAANPPFCAHAGGSYIKSKVYDSSDPSAGGVAGVKVGLGGADGGNAWVVVPTFDDGVYSFTLTPDGGGAKIGTFYLWVMDGSGKRISDVGGPIVINGLPPDAAGSCWAGSVDFWKR